jgi:hypothetical protein
MWDTIDYIIKVIGSFLFGIYFVATEQYIGGVIMLVMMLLNIKWFIRDLKE